MTVDRNIPRVNDGELIVVEDVHTSNVTEFGNPSRYSFVNFAKHVVDSVNSRSSDLASAKNGYWQRVHSVAF